MLPISSADAVRSGQTLSNRGQFAFNAIRAARGLPPNAPRVVFWLYCGDNETEVQEGVEWAIAFGREAGGHYQFLDPSNAARFKDLKGYEDYARGTATGSGGLPTVDETRAAQRANQVIGTPEECIDKIREFQALTHAQEFVFICQFGGMPMDRAEKHAAVRRQGAPGHARHRSRDAGCSLS